MGTNHQGRKEVKIATNSTIGVNYLSREELIGLTASEIYVLDEILRMLRVARKPKHGSKNYSVQSERYMAGKLNLCRVTVSRAVSRLYNLKLIDRLRRRKVDGRWRTNLYRLPKTLWLRKQIAENMKVHPVPHRVAEMLHLDRMKQIIVVPKTAFETAEDGISAIRDWLKSKE